MRPQQVSLWLTSFSWKWSLLRTEGSDVFKTGCLSSLPSGEWEAFSLYLLWRLVKVLEVNLTLSCLLPHPRPWLRSSRAVSSIELPTLNPQQSSIIFQVFPPWHRFWLPFQLLGVCSGKPQLPVFTCLFGLGQLFAGVFLSLCESKQSCWLSASSASYLLLGRVVNSKLLICETRLVLHFLTVRYKRHVTPLVVL